MSQRRKSEFPDMEILPILPPVQEIQRVCEMAVTGDRDSIRKLVTFMNEDPLPRRVMMSYKVGEALVNALNTVTGDDVELIMTLFIGFVGVENGEDYSIYLVSCGVLTAVQRFLDSEDEGTISRALFFLSNIITDSADILSRVIESSVIFKLERFIGRFSTSEQIMSNTYYFVSALMKMKPLLSEDEINVMKKLLLYPFETHTYAVNMKIWSDICWSLSFINGEEPYLDIFSRDDVITTLIEFMKRVDVQMVSVPATRAVGSLTTVNDEFCVLLMGHGVLDSINEVIHSKSFHTTHWKEIFWVASNLFGTDDINNSLQIVLKSDILNIACKYVIENGASLTPKTANLFKEMSFCVANALYPHNDDYLQVVLKRCPEIVLAGAEAFKELPMEGSLISILAKGYINLFQFSVNNNLESFLDVMQSINMEGVLRRCKELTISTLAKKRVNILLESYFPEEEDTDVNM